MSKENNHGHLHVLPNELLLEIVSYFDPPAALEHMNFSYPPRPRFERQEALIALSETCRSLRQFFRPIIWERIEVCSGLRIGRHPPTRLQVSHERKNQRDLSREILRQLGVATIMEPTLSQYVRIVNVEVPNFALRRIFVTLGNSFSLFPNLHTVKITQLLMRTTPGSFTTPVSLTAQTAVKRGFRKRTCYPQIQSAILSQIAYPLLQLCPNLRSFESGPGFDYLLEGMSLRHPRRTVAKAFPSLSEISVCFDWYDLRVMNRETTKTNFVALLKLFTSLQVLVIHSISTNYLGIKAFILSIPSEKLKPLKQVILRPPLGTITEEIMDLSII